MAATTKDRATIVKYIERTISLTLATSSVIPGGTIVCTDATGKAVVGADTAAQRCEGISEHAADQTKGDTTIRVCRGTFWLGNDGTIALADVGGVCTILDNQTVSKAATTTNDIGAGIIEDVDSVKGVLVAMLGGRVDAV
jgi:hypothetical protein